MLKATLWRPQSWMLVGGKGEKEMDVKISLWSCQSAE
jgi:hypothetical protein